MSPLGLTTVYGEYFYGLRRGQAEPNDWALPDLHFAISTSTVCAGLMQSCDAASLDTYIAWRHYCADGNIAAESRAVRAVSFDSFDAIMTGARISF